MIVGERHETVELYALQVCDNLVLRRTLLAGESGVNERGYRGRAEEEGSRLEHLRAHKERFERAVAEDRRRVRKRA
jgi:hypothetical protein